MTPHLQSRPWKRVMWEYGWKYRGRIERDLNWERGCNGLLWMAWVALFGRQEIPYMLLVSRWTQTFLKLDLCWTEVFYQLRGNMPLAQLYFFQRRWVRTPGALVSTGEAKERLIIYHSIYAKINIDTCIGRYTQISTTHYIYTTNIYSNITHVYLFPEGLKIVYWTADVKLCSTSIGL